MAGQAPLYGTDASVTFPTGGGCLFNAFGYNLTQSVMEAIGFGAVDANAKGAVRRATGFVSGVTTKGSTNDKPGHAIIVPESAPLTLTWFTGCTLVFNAVFSALSLGVALEAASSSNYAYTRDGATTETWVTT